MRSRLKRLYTASGLLEAYLLRDYLDAEGIGTLVFNEHSVGAVGELPCNEALPELWVRDEAHYERARALVLAYERRSESRASRTCPGCAEANPGTFDICWRCGTILDS